MYKRQLLDSAFFAYREDADLAWKAQIMGWKYLYNPKACAYHRRVVLPSNRDEVDGEINLMGVRNRFLLQINNYLLSYDMRIFVFGILLRNFLVLVGVLIKERTSISGLLQAYSLRKRAKSVRELRYQSSKETMRSLSRWFAVEPYVEELDGL